MGVGRGLLGDKMFIFEDQIDGFFVISKDDFYNVDMPKSRSIGV